MRDAQGIPEGFLRDAGLVVSCGLIDCGLVACGLSMICMRPPPRLSSAPLALFPNDSQTLSVRVLCWDNFICVYNLRMDWGSWDNFDFRHAPGPCIVVEGSL